MGVPEGFSEVNKVFGNVFVSLSFTEVINVNKHGQPTGFSLALSVGSKEVFSFNVEFSIITNVNKNVELLLSVWSEEIVF